MILVACLVSLLLPSAALAAGPTRDTINLDDPQIDIDETAFATGFCGFPVDAQVSGHIGIRVFPGGRSVVGLNNYAIRITYSNPATGASVFFRDIGPDRFYVKDGVAYIAVTGRATSSAGNIGVVKIDLATDTIVHQAGNDTGLFYDQLCGLID
jgi:hypothetical protein